MRTVEVEEREGNERGTTDVCPEDWRTEREDPPVLAYEADGACEFGGHDLRGAFWEREETRLEDAEEHVIGDTRYETGGTV